MLTSPSQLNGSRYKEVAVGILQGRVGVDWKKKLECCPHQHVEKNVTICPFV